MYLNLIYIFSGLTYMQFREVIIALTITQRHPGHIISNIYGIMLPSIHFFELVLFTLQ